jgi:hypothetical protein
MDQHLWLSLAIPAAFLLITGIVKSLVKSVVTWSNFYLGLDAALAALANGIVNIVDIVRDAENDHGASTAAAQAVIEHARQNRELFTGAFIFSAFFVLLIVMLIHQRWEAPVLKPVRSDQRVRRGVWLGIVANSIGTGALLVFIYTRLKGLL